MSNIMKPNVDQPENPLFTNGVNFNMNACVGDNGGPYNLFDYGKGFFEGGHAIVKAATENFAPVDLLIYPAAFSYRHAIELLLKQLTVSLGALVGAGDAYEKHHKMADLWNAIEDLNSKLEKAMIEPEHVSRAGEIVGHFDSFDPTGQVFRYPENKKDKQHLADHGLINVEVLRDHMKELQAILESWYFKAEDRREDQLEMEAEVGAMRAKT